MILLYNTDEILGKDWNNMASLLALLSGSETFVHYTVQIYYPVRASRSAQSFGLASRCALVA